MKVVRFDFIFSYWIFFWYICYILKITKLSPKFALIFGLIENLLMLVLMIVKKSKNIFNFILINTLIKVMPVLSLANEKIKVSDIYFTIFLFVLFILWLGINNKNLIGTEKLVYNSILKNKTPLLNILNKLKI